VGNQPALAEVALAVWARDAVLLPVEEGLPEEEMAKLKRRFEPAVVITAPGGRPAIERIDRPRAAAPEILHGAAMIRLTSGSTGEPRGAVMGPEHLIAGGLASLRKIGLRPEDVGLGAVPLHHAYGFDHLILPMILQGTPVVLLRRPLPALLFRALRLRAPICLFGVPYLLDLLARHPGPPRPRTSLRVCVSAGAPLTRATAGAFRERFGVPVRTLYGSSECGAITFDDSADSAGPEGCVGTPMPGVTIRLQRGRIAVRSPLVGRGYFPDPSPGFARGRFLTPDLGRVDSEGRLHLRGRVSGLVNVGGRKVNPDEIQRAILALDGVSDAVAMGVNDPLRGERVEAWVVARAAASISGDEVRARLARSLSAHKMPKAIHFVAEIPRTSRGKVDRVSLLRSRTAPRP
jgi:long-chain acyl-CoA synthetase